MSTAENQSHFLPHLHTLSLRACELTNLPDRVALFFRRIAKIKLAGNELACYRDTAWLIRMIQAEPRRFYRVQDMKCASPKPLQGRKMVAIDVAALPARPITRDSSGTSASNFSDHGNFQPPQHTHLSVDRHLMPTSTSPEEDTSRAWVITFIACLMTASVVSLVFLVLLSCCAVEGVRRKRVSLCRKVSRMLRCKKDPSLFPSSSSASSELANSNRTLYRSRDDSIFMVGTPCMGDSGDGLGYPPLSPYEELDQRMFSRPGNIYENDCLSTVSTIRSSLVEIRV